MTMPTLPQAADILPLWEKHGIRPTVRRIYEQWPFVRPKPRAACAWGIVAFDAGLFRHGDRSAWQIGDAEETFPEMWVEGLSCAFDDYAAYAPYAHDPLYRAGYATGRAVRQALQAEGRL